MAADIQYSIVVPAHNEEENLEQLVSRIDKQISKHADSYEIIIVNDNSTDKSTQTLDTLKKRFSHLRPIHRTSRPGVGNSMREGLRNARGEYIIGLDGDLSHDPAEIRKFIKKMHDYDMVCGSRYTAAGKAHMNLSRVVISKLFNIIFRTIIGLPIRDFTSGYRLYRREIVDRIRLTSTGFGIYIELPIKAYLSGFRLCEVPITYHTRTYGTSNLSYLKQGPEYCKVALVGLLTRILNKPKCMRNSPRKR